MNKPFRKLLGVIMALALLSAPAAAFADDEQQPVPVNVRTGANDYVFVPGAGLDVHDLYLNDIPYQTQQSPGGDIVVRTGDLIAAAVATQYVEDFNARYPEKPFDTGDNLCLASGYGVKSKRDGLPDVERTLLAMNKMRLSVYDRSEYVPALVSAINAFARKLSKEMKTEEGLPKEILALIRGINANERTFIMNLQTLYALLHEVRAAIAIGDIPRSMLDLKETKDLLGAYRELVSLGGMDLESIAFWDDDETWTAWAAENGRLEGGGFSLQGQQFRLSDGQGKGVQVAVASVRRPADSSPAELEVVSYSIIPDTDILSFFAGEDYLPDGIDGVMSAPRIFIIDGPDDAIFEWDCSPLPDGLDFETDSSDPSGAYIVGTPAVIDEEGTGVTVSASTTVDGQLYTGSLELVIIVTDPSADVEPGP